MTNLFNNVFSEQRTPNDICYVSLITSILNQKNHSNPSGWIEKLKNAQEIKAAAPKLQRFLINRSLRISLGLLDVDTTAARYCLVDDCSHEQYVSVFEEVVAPVMVQNNL